MGVSCAGGQNPRTRTQVASLVAAGRHDELRARLLSHMNFGTAGLRAAMGAGFSRINDLTVIQATQVSPAHLTSRSLPNILPLLPADCVLPSGPSRLPVQVLR